MIDSTITNADSQDHQEARGGAVELRQLEYFVAVASEQSFTRAARRLHVVQSAVSAAITALEKDLRVVLIERSSRRVQLTRAGEALLPEAHAVLDAAGAARDAVEGLSRGLQGTLRVGMLSDLGLMDLPGLARDFRDRYPGVELQLRDATAGSRGMLAALSNYEIDVAFAGTPGSLPAAFTGRELLRVPQMLAVTAGHRLAGRQGVAIGDLEQEMFIDLPQGFAMRTVADNVFAACGLRRVIAAEVGGISAAAAFVQAGVGIAILPPYAIARHEGLRAVKIREHDFRWSLNAVVARRRRQTMAAAALLNLVDSHLIPQPGVEYLPPAVLSS
jgi:DNA-binding transcriptional LysR family regulator